MSLGRSASALGLVLTAALAWRPAAAQTWTYQDPLHFYIGAGIGESFIDNHDNGYGSYDYGAYGPYRFNSHDIAWKGMLGIRPIPYLGAEIEYLDFGHPNDYSNYYGYYHQDNEQFRGPAAFAVGYLPLPFSPVDLYGKLGVAHLQSQINTYVPGGYSCPPGAFCPAQGSLQPYSYRYDHTNTTLAYGAGAQFNLAALGLRLEYERVSESVGDPQMVSFGVTWSF